MKHIVITRLSAMGDVAMAVPVIQALVTQHNVKVTVVSRPFFKPFFEDIKNVNFFSADVDNKYKGILGIIKLFKDISKLKPDYIADLHDVLRTKIIRTLFLLKGTKTVYIDKGRTEKKKLIRKSNKKFHPLIPMTTRYSNTFKKLGFNINLNNIQVLNKRIPTENALSFIESNKILIGIAPFAQYNTKVYPNHLMKEVIFKLSQNKNHTIILFGGKQEIDKLKELKQNIENVKIPTNKINFTEELTLIQNLDIMISMDSANGHIAAMYSIPTITIWGQTHPYAGFTPFGMPYEYSITPDLNLYPMIPTSVYGNKNIKDYENCMETIKPDNIIDKVMTILNKK